MPSYLLPLLPRPCPARSAHPPWHPLGSLCSPASVPSLALPSHAQVHRWGHGTTSHNILLPSLPFAFPHFYSCPSSLPLFHSPPLCSPLFPPLCSVRLGGEAARPGVVRPGALPRQLLHHPGPRSRPRCAPCGPRLSLGHLRTEREPPWERRWALRCWSQRAEQRISGHPQRLWQQQHQQQPQSHPPRPCRQQPQQQDEQQ